MSRQINCIAVDDEPFALRIIEDFCGKIPSIDLKRTFNNPVEALSYLNNHKPDIIFLDIRMPDISGLELAKRLDTIPFVIFTTAYAEYAVQSYNLDAVDYLLKPFDFERFYKAIEKAKVNLNLHGDLVEDRELEQSITLKIEYKNVRIVVNDILYLESMDNYVKIITPNKTFIPQINLKKILEILPEERFVRVHKSYAVPYLKIDYYTRREISIRQVKIPIGRSYLARFLDAVGSHDGGANPNLKQL